MALSRYLFVGGAQRTGTTMLQSLLCQHPETNGMLGEASYLRGLVQAYQLGKFSFPNETEDYFDDIDALRVFHSGIIGEFLEYVAGQSRGIQCLVLKEPHLTKLFPLLFELVPSARFLLIVRDPRDAVASMVSVGEKMKLRGEKHFFQRRDMEQLSEYYKSFYMPTLAFSDNGFRQQLRIIRYEDLVSNDANTLRAMYDFTGLEFDVLPEGDVDLGKFETLTKTERYEPWSTNKLGKSPVPTSVGNYKSVLTPDEVRKVEKNCRDFFRQFSYA